MLPFSLVKGTGDNGSWINEKDPEEFSTTKLSATLASTVSTIRGGGGDSRDGGGGGDSDGGGGGDGGDGGGGGALFPYRVFGKIVRRGDATLVTADSLDEGDFTALVFLNTVWGKNDYGELYL